MSEAGPEPGAVEIECAFCSAVASLEQLPVTRVMQCAACGKALDLAPLSLPPARTEVGAEEVSLPVGFRPRARVLTVRRLPGGLELDIRESLTLTPRVAFLQSLTAMGAIWAIFGLDHGVGLHALGFGLLTLFCWPFAMGLIGWRRVRATREVLSLRWAPLPWFGKTVRVAQIADVDVDEERLIDGENNTRTVWNVVFAMKSQARRVNFVTHLRTPEVAWAIRNALTQFLDERTAELKGRLKR